MTGAGKISSFFVNPAGIIIWALAAAALYYNRLALPAGICLIFCLLFLSSWLWAKYALTNVEAKVPSGIQCAFPGGSFSFPFSVSNKKLLPLIWIELAVPLAKGGCVAPASEENSKMLYDPETDGEVPGASACVPWILWHQEASSEISLKAVRRGLCTISKAAVSSGDLLGLGIKEKMLSFQAPPSFAVYPAVFPVETQGLIQGTTDMEAGKNGYMEDVTLLKMNRPYQPGDPAKKINWRQLARQDRVFVNVHETVFPKLATFFLDLASFREGTKERNTLNSSEYTIWKLLRMPLEDMISLTASCILKLDESRICCGLIIPGTSEDNCVIQYPGKHGSSPEELLYSLAAVDYHAEDVSVPVWEIADHFSMLGTLYIVTCSYDSMTIDPEAFSGLGSAAVLARYPSEADETCPLKLFYLENLKQAPGQQQV